MADDLRRIIPILLIIFILCVVILIGVGILQNEDQGNLGYAFLYVVFGILSLCALGLLLFVSFAFLISWWEERQSGGYEFKSLIPHWTPTNQPIPPAPQSDGETRNQTPSVGVPVVSDNASQGNTQNIQEESINRSSHHQKHPTPQKSITKYSTSAQYKIFREHYNQAADDTSQRQAFRNQYNPIRFGTSNAMQRREDFSIDPIFQTANDGDYYAIQLGNSNQYAVVPRFDLTFQESSYGPGAMGMVFDCPQFNPQLRYRRVRVHQAAIFESQDKQTWKLVPGRRGQLQLGQGE
ncbi:MAG: hypothetical protein HY231_05885 [Acidobacteria bacterium]|nr:hypothetical protein [Acidobacteriota bacterium]